MSRASTQKYAAETKAFIAKRNKFQRRVHAEMMAEAHRPDLIAEYEARQEALRAQVSQWEPTPEPKWLYR